jgi:hypothetical protein
MILLELEQQQIPPWIRMIRSRSGNHRRNSPAKNRWEESAEFFLMIETDIILTTNH